MTITNIESEILIKAISNGIRRNIIRLLIGKSMSYTEIAHLLSFNLKKESGKFNFHLKELVNANIIQSKEDLYHLTSTGEEMYYFLLDIEKDKAIDPYGMMTALIRIEGTREFWFFSSTIGMIGSLWAIIIGFFGLFAIGDTLGLQVYGSSLILLGLFTEIICFRYYLTTVSELLGGQSRSSKIMSSIFILSIQWYLIRTKNRMSYMLSSFVLLFSWFLLILTGLLHLAEGVEGVGILLYWFDGIALVGLFVGLILLRRLYNQTQ